MKTKILTLKDQESRGSVWNLKTQNISEKTRKEDVEIEITAG